VTAAAPPVERPATPEPGALTPTQIRTVFLGLMTALLLAALDQTIVATALPTIVGDLGGLSSLSWVVTAYLLSSTVSIPLYGKVSDLYGRKRVFQFAIVLFLVGSVASGLAQTMGQLIGSRAIQGAGAGGLLALTQTIIGDIVSPRERGKYIGYVGAVFGVASVAGPLLGGYFVDVLGWRWVFYVNLPLGALALVLVQRFLRLPVRHSDAKVDWLGAALLSVAVVSLLLLTVWGGDTYAWTSPVILGLGALSLVAAGAFWTVEHRVAEPILPPGLFAQPVFVVSAAIAAVVAVSMFGGIVYLPLFLQVVSGESATSSGLLTLPLIGGLLVASIVSGRLISRWGRYKVFPIAGTALAALGLFLLSTMDVDTSRGVASTYMAVLGVGIGLTMQVVVLAVQNAVPPEHLGTGTSSMQFFRSIGATIGVAILGAVLNAQLAARLAGTVPAEVLRSAGEDLTSSPAAIAALAPEVRLLVQTALAESITTVLAITVPVALIGFVLSFFLKELPLRTRVASAPADHGA
jgi:EmrB/QacA subfamily drug resistance transporter